MEPTRTTENTKILIGPILSNSFEKVNQNGVIVVGWSDHDPPGIYLLKVNNRNTRTSCEICSELTIKTLERCQWRRSGVFIVNFEHFHTCSVVSIVNFEHINVAWWTYCCSRKTLFWKLNEHYEISYTLTKNYSYEIFVQKIRSINFADYSNHTGVNNVYQELVPKFLSAIFSPIRTLRVKSNTKRWFKKV